MKGTVLIALLSVLGEPDNPLVLRHPPVPFNSGGSAIMTCGDITVHVSWSERKERGLVSLDGWMEEAGRRRSLDETLSRIWANAAEFSEAEQTCTSDGVMTTLVVWPKDDEGASGPVVDRHAFIVRAGLAVERLPVIRLEPPL